MNYMQMILQLSKKPIRFLATATTGLDQDDELLAVSMVNMDPTGALTGWKTLIRLVTDRDRLLKSQQYHGVSETRMAAEGLLDDEFNARLQEQLRDGETFSYNPTFQTAFLDGHLGDVEQFRVWDLPMMLAGARKGLKLDRQAMSSLDGLSRFFQAYAGRVPGFNKLCESEGLTRVDPTLLPADIAVCKLYALWQRLEEQAVIGQEQLQA